MAIAEYADLDGLALAELVRNGDIKPIELVEEAIRRAEQLNPTLNFVVYQDYERAWHTARGELPKGHFTGVPFTRASHLVRLAENGKSKRTRKKNVQWLCRQV